VSRRPASNTITLGRPTAGRRSRGTRRAPAPRYARHESWQPQAVSDTDVNPSQDDIAFATVLQSDGKIIVVGTAAFTTPASIAVTRTNANGGLDSTFGSNGSRDEPAFGRRRSAFAATLQADGKLLVAGRSCPCQGFSFLLLRYNTAGRASTAVLSTRVSARGGSWTTPFHPAAQPPPRDSGDGTQILVAGHSENRREVPDRRRPVHLSRCARYGSYYGIRRRQGFVTTQVGSLDADAAALAVQPGDAKIVVAGSGGEMP